MKDLLAKGSTLILLGTGGVGKTTVAAALALAGAQIGLDTAVVTVDPAPRLRDALGLDRLGGEPIALGARRLKSAGLKPQLRLSAMALDAKGVWDRMVERFIHDSRTRQRVLENPFYRQLTERFAGSDSYAALQQLYDLHAAGRYELTIVDTPPAAHAFEFIQAPARLARLLDSRAARWLFTPYISMSSFAMRLASRSARFVVRELERVAGAGVLTSASDFFVAAADAVESMLTSLRKTEALLHSKAVRFVMVTTAEPGRLQLARELIDEMKHEGLHLSAVVINRFLDEQVFAELANRSRDGIGVWAAASLDAVALDAQAGAGTRALADYLTEYRRLATTGIERIGVFARSLPKGVEVAIAPGIQAGVGSLKTVARVARYLIDSDQATAQYDLANRIASSTADRMPE